MKSFLLFAVVMAGLALSACDQQTGTPVEYAQACDVANEKKYIEVTGVLDAKGSVYCSNTGGGPVRCGFSLLQNEGDAKGFSADIAQDGFSNAVEKFRNGYQKKEIVIHDNNGSVFGIPQKVKLVGKMNVAKGSTPDSDVCYLTVTKIEKVQ